MKVEISIEKRKYSSSVNGGAEYTSVGYMGGIYGAGSPCDTELEVQDAIAHAETRIKSEGDMPVIRDLRSKQTILSFLNQLKGGE
jgi:hypothetical protein